MSQKLIDIKNDIYQKCVSSGITLEIDSNSFSEGTIIVDQPYTYIKLLEDVTCEFLPNNDFRPNQNNPKYQGKEFVLGFFTLISIKCDYVYFDLNGHLLQWSDTFSLQQRFGSIIELGSAPFITGQGPGDFGDYIPANYVVITNGKLGRSPHHSVHGNTNRYIFIDNCECFDFEVVAFQLAGLKYSIIEDINITGNFKKIPVIGKYSAFRFLISFCKELLSELSNSSQITFVTSILMQLLDINNYVLDEFQTNQTVSLSDFKNKTGLLDGTAYAMSFGKNGVQVRDFKKRKCPFSSISSNSTDSSQNILDAHVRISNSGKRYHDNPEEDKKILSDNVLSDTEQVYIRNVTIHSIHNEIKEFLPITVLDETVEEIDSVNYVSKGNVLNDFSGSVYDIIR